MYGVVFTVDLLFKLCYISHIMLPGLLLAFGAAFFISSGFISIKRGLQSVDYQVFIASSIPLGLLLSTILLLASGQGLSGLTLKSILPFAVTGGLGGGLLARVCSTLATHEIGAPRTHAIESANPIVTSTIGVLFLGERISVQLGLGIVGVITGAGFLSYSLHKKQQDEMTTQITRPIFGLTLALYTALAYGIQPIMGKIGLNMGTTPLQGMFIRFATATFLYSLYLVIARPSLNFRVGGKITYYFLAGIFWTLGPLLSLYSLRFISATILAALLKVGPLFTVILAFTFLKGIEQVDWKMGSSAGLIVIGAVLVSTA